MGALVPAAMAVVAVVDLPVTVAAATTAAVEHPLSMAGSEGATLAALVAVVETTMVALTSLAVVVDTAAVPVAERQFRQHCWWRRVVHNIGSNQSNTQGGNAGNGQVVIDKL